MYLMSTASSLYLFIAYGEGCNLLTDKVETRILKKLLSLQLSFIKEHFIYPLSLNLFDSISGPVLPP